jgi:predicted O-methyltransferase YrrM
VTDPLSRVIEKTFRLWQRLGLTIRPNHYYEPIPDLASLPPSVWARRSELVGIELRAEAQLALLDEMATRWRREYEAFSRLRTPIEHEFFLDNGAFESVDAEVLYSMIRTFKPRRIIEIGSGHSTRLAAQAMERNRHEDGVEGELTAIEPYPSATLRAGFPGLTRCLAVPVQQVPRDTFDALGENDILFIDSSHVLKIGGDVQYEYLEVLPRLRPGVLIHIHDIFLPMEYPKGWVLDAHRFWTEQYLLQAFLAFNSKFEIVWCGSYMSLDHTEALARAIPSYRPGLTAPGSIWLRRVA